MRQAEVIVAVMKASAGDVCPTLLRIMPATGGYARPTIDEDTVFEQMDELYQEFLFERLYHELKNDVVGSGVVDDPASVVQRC